MGVRENKIETYLKNKVRKVLNGESRKWLSPGRDGVHDQILFINNLPPVFVEVKTENGKLSKCQKREHKRLNATGAIAIFTTVYGYKGVDSLVKCLAHKIGLDND